MPSSSAPPPVLTRDLVAAGYTYDELSRLTRRGELIHLRRGAYAWAGTLKPDDHVAERHRRLVEATVPLLAADAVVSHVSAAVLHGLPVWSDRLQRVGVTRPDARSGKRRGHLHVRAAPLTAAEIVDLAGLRVTSLARTVADLGRELPLEQAVTACDAALRAGCTQAELTLAVEAAKGWPGAPAARRVVDFGDGRSESPGESLSRVAFSRLGLPAPALQFEVYDGKGLLVGRADFGWEEQRTLGEFDGRVKYGRLLRPGQLSEDVVYQEKRREDALRDLGWQVVRWSWADLKDAATIADRLWRAFSRTGLR